MAKVFESITGEVRTFIEAQQMFFVATAPLSAEGHVNLSPKGFDSFRILDPHTVAYLDLVGSGIETVSHLKENGRIVFMFCAFTGDPLTVRLHGTGEVFQNGSPGYDELKGHFGEFSGMRSIIRANITRVADSCGWGTPLMDYKSDRNQHADFVTKLEPDKLKAALRETNLVSIDGLTGMEEL